MHPRCVRARQGAATLQPAGRQQLATTSIAASLHQATYLLRLTCDWLNCTSTCYLSTPVITVTVTPQEASRLTHLQPGSLLASHCVDIVLVSADLCEVSPRVKSERLTTHHPVVSGIFRTSLNFLGPLRTVLDRNLQEWVRMLFPGPELPPSYHSVRAFKSRYYPGNKYFSFPSYLTSLWGLQCHSSLSSPCKP